MPKFAHMTLLIFLLSYVHAQCSESHNQPQKKNNSMKSSCVTTNQHQATYTTLSASIPIIKLLKPVSPTLLHSFIKELVEKNPELSNKQFGIMISQAHALSQPSSSTLSEVMVVPYWSMGLKSSL